MLVDIEKIKALEPGKIYCIEVAQGKLSHDLMQAINAAVKKHGVKFMIFEQGTATVIPAPKNLSITDLLNKEKIQEQMAKLQKQLAREGIDFSDLNEQDSE